MKILRTPNTLFSYKTETVSKSHSVAMRRCWSDFWRLQSSTAACGPSARYSIDPSTSQQRLHKAMDAHVRLRNMIWSLTCALRVNIWFLLGLHKRKVHINETLILIGDGAIKVHSATLVCSCSIEKISNFILSRSPLIWHHQRSNSERRIVEMWHFHIAVLYWYLLKRCSFDIDISATFDAWWRPKK